MTRPTSAAIPRRSRRGMRKMSPRLVLATPHASSGAAPPSSFKGSGFTRASILSNDQTLLEHHSRPPPQFLTLALQLTASGEDVSAARRAHRARIACVEHDFGEAFDRLPV